MLSCAYLYKTFDIASTAVEFRGVFVVKSVTDIPKLAANSFNIVCVSGFDAYVVTIVMTLPLFVVRFKSFLTSPGLTTPFLSMSITPPMATTGYVMAPANV